MSARAAMVALLSALVLGLGIGRAGDKKLVRQTYAVADLVIPVGERSPAKSTEEQLIKLLTSTIAPNSWADMGGVGTIEYFPQTYGMVICQTADVQDQVQDLLAAMRRLQDQEVATEVKLVEVSEEVFQDLKQCGLLKAEDQENVTFLDDTRARRLMERIQQDTTTNVMQSPKQTAFNGQATRLDVTDEQTFVTGVDIRSHDGHITTEPKKEVVPIGIRLRLRPVISADHRFVRLSLDLKLNSLVSDKVPLFPVTVPVGPEANAGPDAKPVVFTQYIQQPRINRLRMDRTMVIPDGRTAVLTGLKKECEVSKDVPLALPSKIPYAAKLFRKQRCYSRETHHVLVLVTPRILVAAEKEEKQTKVPACGKKVSVCPSKLKDGRMPIMNPVAGDAAVRMEEPSDASILRSLSPLMSLPGIYETTRDKVEIVKEEIVDALDPPRFWSLIGPAQLHHSHWKCSVYYTETITGSFPFSFAIGRPRVEVVYLDLDHLHLYNAGNCEKIK